MDVVDEALANSHYSTTVAHRSGIAVDDSTLFENTTLPAIDMDLSTDPDILNICRKSYSLEDITAMVDETDSESEDTVSHCSLISNRTLNYELTTKPLKPSATIMLKIQ